MSIYSIGDLERLTGIKAHTIRVWEKRYRLILPARTDTNIRYYTDENLRLLFNIALLKRAGYKISKLVKMRPEEIASLVAELTRSNLTLDTRNETLVLAMLDLDESAFERVFLNYQWEHGFERTMLDVIYPFLEKLNELWLTRSISLAHEKFITQIIRRKLMAAIDGEVTKPKPNAPRFLLYLPEDERQELVLLFLFYLLRRRGFRVLYLGSGVSIGDLQDAVQNFKPHFVYTILNAPPSRQSVQGYIEKVSKVLGEAQLLVTGIQVFMNGHPLPPNVKRLNGLPETLQLLEQWKPTEAHP
ncbi:MAG: MerR family transcriptional regulator [Saprospiraceae bacterium]|nr:MerR family transcriptional regulator [Saprospiraceae bacterium]MDW8483877.1 MerR family transcriptional regulator [Saprospiraceae bacterium]